MGKYHFESIKIKNYFLQFFVIFILAGSLSSCTTTKNLSKKNIDKEYKSSKLFHKLNKSNIDFEWYSFKASTDVFFNGTTVGGYMDVRMKKNEFIWMSIKKFGMEFARIMIRPDSFFVIDRFNKQYMKMPVDSFKKEYNVPFDFYEIQNILAGNNAINNQIPTQGRMINDEYILKTKNNKLNVIYTFNSEFKVKRAKFSDLQNHTIVSEFSKFTPFNKHIVSFNRKYSYPDEKNPKYFIKFKIKKLEIDIPKKIKFEIPNNYDKV